MTDDRLKTPALDSGTKRRNRDDPSRGPTAFGVSTGSEPDDLQPVSQAAHDTPEPPEPDSLEDVIQRGHRWLRFSAALEAQFQASTLESRRKLLIFCGLLGILSIYPGTANIAELNPDIAAMALRVAHQNLLACGVGLAVLPGHWVARSCPSWDTWSS